MKRVDYDIAKAVLESWCGEQPENDQDTGKRYLSDLQFILESMKDRSYPSEEFLGEELLAYIEAQKEDAQQEEKEDLLHPERQGEKVCFEKLHQLLKPQNASLGTWPSPNAPTLRQELALHLALRKGTEEVFEQAGPMLELRDMKTVDEQVILKELVADSVVERAALLAKYEDPDWAFDEHRFLNGELEENAYREDVTRWYSLKEDKINDHGILVAGPSGKDSLAFTATLDAEKTGGYFAKYAKELTGNPKAESLIAAGIGSREEIRRLFDKVLAPMLKEDYATREKIVERKNRYAEERKKFLEQLELTGKLQKELGEFQWKLKRILDAQALQEKALADARGEIAHLEKLITDAETVRDGFTKDRTSLDSDMEELAKVIEQKTADLKEMEKQINEYKAKTTELYAKEEETLKSVGVMTKLLSKKKYDEAVALADQYHKEAGEAQDEDLRLSREAKKLGTEMHDLLDQQNRMEEKRAEFTEEIAKRNRDINGWKQTISKRGEEANEAEEILMGLQKELDELLEDMKKQGPEENRVIIDRAFVQELCSEDQELSGKHSAQNPWFTGRYQKEREKLFTLALSLLGEFILSSRHYGESLAILAYFWGFKADEKKGELQFSDRDKELIAPALFQLLSLLIPVMTMPLLAVGETFESAKKPGTIGRLVVTNAQTVRPRTLAGALLRSRSALLLGEANE